MSAFSVLTALGMATGLLWVLRQAPEQDQAARLAGGIWSLSGALIGGRGGYVIMHWPYFQGHLQEIPQVWLGGLTWAGALGGAIIGLVLFAIINSVFPGTLADDLLPLLFFTAAGAWVGCWFEGCAYGVKTDAWYGILTRDEWGYRHVRFPVQLLSALACVLGGMAFGLVNKFKTLKIDKIPGLTGSLGLGVFSLIMLVASLLRVDPAPVYRGLRYETWAALIFQGCALLSSIAVIWHTRRKIPT